MFTTSYQQSEINAYIYGSKQITSMVQADLQQIQENDSFAANYNRQGYLVVIGYDDFE